MLLRFVFIAVFAFPFLTGSAQAQEYTAPTWTNLVQTLIRMNALDVSDDLLIDEYGLVTECDLYDTFHDDDFKWNKVRKAMRNSIRQNIATYSTRYRYDTKMQLDRYDFTTKTFRFTEKSMLKNDNVFPLFAGGETECNRKRVVNIPLRFGAVLGTPVYLEGLPLPERDAKNLLVRMEKNENFDRIIYASFNMRIVYIEPLRKIRRKPYDPTQYKQPNQIADSTGRIDTQLESVSFYEDPQRTKLIYQYQQ